jgi:hypothetical protein
MRKLSLVCLLSVFISTSASAGFLIDPYLGTGQFKSTIDITGASEDTETITATGARIGYSFLLFSAGIDYQMASVDKDKVTSTSIFVGVDMPILVRAWAEYFVSSDYDRDDGQDVTFKDGASLGIGFTGLPFVSLNVELQNVNYEIETSGSKFDVKTAATVFSISLPLDL